MDLEKIEKQWNDYNEEFENSDYMDIDKHTSMAMQVGPLISEVKQLKQQSQLISSRRAFQVFIRFQLANAAEEGKIDLSPEEIEKFANGIEDDPHFYEKLDDLLKDYLEDFGSNHGINF